MPVVQPPKPRYRIDDLGSSFTVTIPSPKNWFQIVFLGFWLIPWAVGETVAGTLLISGAISLVPSALLGRADAGIATTVALPGLFLLGWFGLWTVGGGLAGYSFLWLIAGREVIEVSALSVAHSRRLFGAGRTKEYLAEHVRDLRSVPLPYGPFGWATPTSLWGRGFGAIAFDYGARTIRFGAGADEAEAKQIVAAIQQRFPQYRNTQHEPRKME